MGEGMRARSHSGWRLGKRSELDGVRGLAILLVILAHLEVPGFRSGGVAGVTLFFVLSGFLITSLLMEEFGRAGRIELRAFYRRRMLRLLPALFALIAAVFVYESVAGGNPIADALLALLYVGNWVRVGGQGLGLLSHTWSLAIEEQFYLVWPAVLLLARPLAPRRWRIVFALALIGALGSMLERAALWHGAGSINRVYFATDARADGLLLGCALALWLTSGRQLRLGWIAGVTALALLAAATVTSGSRAIYIVAPTLASIGGLLLIAFLVTGDRGALFRWPCLCATGRISYGLYLWHVPIVWVLLPHLARLPLLVRGAIIVGLAWAAAAASYRWVEQPFLRRKHRAAEAAARAGSPRPVPEASPAA
jgi:peptidoglycan/LPS O-acetylase OafA/YrhL